MPSVYFKTYGCQMNVYDSLRMMRLLKPLDYTQTEDLEEADLILFNTCTVREKAKHKFLSELGFLKTLKQKKGDLIIGLGGCVAQEEGEKLLRRLPHLDLVFGVDQINELPHLIDQIKKTKDRVSLTAFDTDPKFSLSYLHVDKSPVSAFVTIIKGCDKFCSFCIVPFTRGREKSRSPREILQEIELMVQKGTREVTLLGQNVNSYSHEEYNFPRLLRLIDEVSDLKRVRFTSPHPQDFCDGMIECFVELKHLCKHLHLPVQSGNNRVLQKMKRSYTIEHYKERLQKLKEKVPHIALSTDIIVGFPGETHEEYEDTLRLLEEVRFDFIYSFKYSPRRATLAARTLKDDVAESEKEERLYKLQALQDQISLEKNKSLVGKTIEVLVEKKSDKNGKLQGRTEANKLVHFDGDISLLGKFTHVTLQKAMPHSLLGEIPRLM